MKKIVKSQLSQISKEDRNFKKPSSISQSLHCTICTDVLHQPTRLFCGHTFCFDCYLQWFKMKKECPICRQKIDRNNIGMDVLAFHIINQQEVFCIYQNCPWQGALEVLELHITHECQHRNKGKKSEELKETRAVDAQVEERINENTGRGDIVARVLLKEKGSRSFDQGSIFRSTDSMSNTNPFLQEQFMTQRQTKIEIQPPNYETYDYLNDILQSNSQ